MLLTARMGSVTVLSFEADPPVLARRLPEGTEIDLRHGIAYLSVVGVRFSDLRVFGVPLTGRASFDQVNVRFYARRRDGDAWRRGVVFVRQIVPFRAIVWAARALYGENAVRRPTRSHGTDMETKGGPPDGVDGPGDFEGPDDFDDFSGSGAPPPEAVGRDRDVIYEWLEAGRWSRIVARPGGRPSLPPDDSLERFLIDRLLAFSGGPGRRTREYELTHPPWTVRAAERGAIARLPAKRAPDARARGQREEGPRAVTEREDGARGGLDRGRPAPGLDDLFDAEIDGILRSGPVHAMVADGSHAAVGPPRRVRARD